MMSEDPVAHHSVRGTHGRFAWLHDLLRRIWAVAAGARHHVPTCTNEGGDQGDENDNAITLLNVFLANAAVMSPVFPSTSRTLILLPFRSLPDMIADARMPVQVPSRPRRSAPRIDSALAARLAPSRS